MNHHSHFRLDLEPYKVFGDTVTPDVASLRDMNEWRSSMSNHVKHSESSRCALKDVYEDVQQNSFPKQLVLPDCSPISELDILVGRSRNVVNHEGNIRFRRIVSSFVPQYFEKDCRTTRCRLVVDIIAAIQLSEGRFLKQSPCGHWVVLSQKEKRNKVGHALRDAASASSTHVSSNKHAKQLPPSPLLAVEVGRESGSSPFEDHTIGVDFPVDLDLLLLMS
jgi:hypothetical protein